MKKVETPSVSVIIPARNEEYYLSLSLPSVLTSSKNYNGSVELILVDNGSSDSTVDIARRHGFKVLSCNQGPVSHLRNIGAKLASGTILAFLDADCIVDPHWLDVCVNALIRNKLGAIGTPAVPDLSNSTWVERGWFQLISGAPRSDYPNWLGTSNLILKKDIFDSIGGFNSFLYTAEDVHLTQKIKKYAPLYLEKSITTIHLRESKTLGELFRREFYRGQDSIRYFFIAENKQNEFLSTFIPPVFVALLISACVQALTVNGFSIFYLTLLFPLFFVFHKKGKLICLLDPFILYIVAFTYFLSRGISSYYHLFSAKKIS